MAVLSVVSVATATPHPEIHGDPQFVGLQGQSFQVHGIDGAVYALVSSATTSITSRFAFLSSGVCPIIDGVPLANCWSHPGSYMSSVGFLQQVSGLLHSVVVEAGSANVGFAAVQVDGLPVGVGDDPMMCGASFCLHFQSSHRLTVRTEQFELTLSNSDRFVNIDRITPLLPLSQLNGTHGLIGQTHQFRIHPSSLKYIEGEVDDYLIHRGRLLGTDFVFNRFLHQPVVTAQQPEWW